MARIILIALSSTAAHLVLIASASCQTPDVKFIVGAIRAADTGAKSVHLEVDSYIGVTPDMKDDLGARAKDYIHMRQGANARWEVRDYGKDGVKKNEQIFVLDGQKEKAFNPINKSGLVTKEQNGAFSYLTAPDPTRITVWDIPLIETLSRDDLRMVPNNFDSDCDKCVVLEGIHGKWNDLPSEGSELSYRLFLNPKINYLPVRIDEIEIRSKAGSEPQSILKETKRLLDYQEVAPGIYFPKMTEEIGFKNGSEFHRNRSILRKVTVNEQIPAVVFN